MKISVRPAKRDGDPKTIFESALEPQNVSISTEEVVLTLVAKDIYSVGASHRYTVTLSAQDIETIFQAGSGVLGMNAAE